MAQWLGLGAFTALAWVQSLVGELRSQKPRGAAKKKKEKKKKEKSVSCGQHIVGSCFGDHSVHLCLLIEEFF